jgi:hypothetical protein
MDHADLADQLIEARLEEALEKARRERRKGTTHCIDCGVQLPEVRQQYALCIECARDHERLEQLIPRLRQ